MLCSRYVSILSWKIFLYEYQWRVLFYINDYQYFNVKAYQNVNNVFMLNNSFNPIRMKFEKNSLLQYEHQMNLRSSDMSIGSDFIIEKGSVTRNSMINMVSQKVERFVYVLWPNHFIFFTFIFLHKFNASIWCVFSLFFEGMHLLVKEGRILLPISDWRTWMSRYRVCLVHNL